MILFLPDADATQAAGERLGQLAENGQVFAAVGEVGAGKTCLAQGLARGLGVPANHYVNSPTFAILQSHPGRVPFHHIDLYRIGDSDELLGLGLEECLDDGVTYIEWPGQAPEVLPSDALWLALTHEDEGRTLRLHATGPVSADLLAKFSA